MVFKMTAHTYGAQNKILEGRVKLFSRWKERDKQQVSESNKKLFKTNLYDTAQIDYVLTLNAQKSCIILFSISLFKLVDAIFSLLLTTSSQTSPYQQKSY